MNRGITQAEYLWLDGAAQSGMAAPPSRSFHQRTDGSPKRRSADRRPWVGLLVTLAAVVSSVAVSAPAHAWQGDKILTGDGQCLDADRNRWWLPDPQPPVEIQSWQCIRGQSNQQWWHNWRTSTIQTPGPDAGPAKCLDAWEIRPGYIDVRLWSCNGGKQQGWTFYPDLYVEGLYLIESEKYRGWCLRWSGDFRPIEMAPCDSDDGTQQLLVFPG
jgi:hypothetical protein